MNKSPKDSPSLQARMRMLADAGNRSAENLRKYAREFEAAYQAFMSEPEKEGALGRMLEAHLQANKTFMEAQIKDAGYIESWDKN